MIQGNIIDINNIDSFSNQDSLNFRLLSSHYEPEHQGDFCKECSLYFIQCQICQGYFDMVTYCESHEDKCRLLYNKYTEKENLVECKDCRNYVKCEEFQIHKQICTSNNANNQKVQCNYCNQTFSISLIEDHEITCQAFQSEYMLVNETIDCNFCKEKFPLIHIQSHELKCKKLKEKQDEIANQINLMKIEYPKEWEQEIYLIKRKDDNLSVIILDRNGTEYKFAVDRLKSSVPNSSVINVYRIQNKYLWEKYSREKAKIIEQKGSCDENWLFHGSRTSNPRSLFTIGFDISFSNDGGSLGRGIYFARKASYSYTSYTYYKNGKGYIFLAKVLTGIPYVNGVYNYGKPSRRKINKINVNIVGNQLKKPPLWDESRFIYFDSVTNVDNKNNHDIDQMYVVYENDKAYPFYLIEFDANGVNNMPVMRGVNMMQIVPNMVNNIVQKPNYADDEEII